MANQIVYDYLEKYGQQYKLEDLKNKILSKGYSKEDIDEAINILGLDEEKKEVGKPLENIKKGGNQGIIFKQEQKMMASRGFRWIRFSGILGLLLMLACLCILVYSYLVVSSYIGSFQISNLSMNKQIIYSGIILAISLLFIFFVSGFFKVAKHTNSKLIRFSSGIYFFLIIISLIAGLVYLFVSLNAEITRIFNISLLFLLFLFIINSGFFFSGLISLRKQIKFTFIAGLFGWLLIIGILGAGFYILYNSGFNTSVFLSLQDIFSGAIKQYMIISAFVLGLIGAIILLFGSLALLSSSKNFE